MIGLILLLPQSPLTAEATSSPEPAPAADPQPPPTPPANRELVAAETEKEENPSPIDLPALESPTELAKLLQTGRPVSTTETILDLGAGAPGLDGTSHIAVITSGPSNYQDASGKWKAIQPKLEKKLGGWTNTDGPFEISLPERLSAATPVTFALTQGSLSLLPETADPTVKGKDKDTTVTYKKALPDTDLVYTSAHEGLKEEIVLNKDKAASRVSFIVRGSGLTIGQDGSGGLQVLAGNEHVATIPPPVATDDSGAAGPVAYELTPLATGTWRLTVSVDDAWYRSAARQFPVTIDPPITTLWPTQDTYVDSWEPQYAHGSSSDILVTKSHAGRIARGLFQFNVSGLAQPDRDVFAAEMRAWEETGTQTAPDDLALYRATNPWSQETTYQHNIGWDTNADPIMATGCPASLQHPSCTQGGWFVWNIPDLVESWMNQTISNQGVMLPGRGDVGLPGAPAQEFHFASSEHSNVNGQDVRPYLIVSYNDPPPPPQPTDPAEGLIVETESPSLQINKPISDPNGDRVYMKYQVATDTSFNNIVVQSNWLERQYHWVVPSGVLKDGQTYRWRAKISDLIPRPRHGGDPKENTSLTRTLTMSLKKWGSDPKWAMWGQGLGNGMRLEVNEVNGNLFLNYPLDSLATPAGPLDLRLSYNSQQTHDFDFSGGWVVSAGSGNESGPMPVRLSIPSWGGVQIRYSDGSRQFFPKLEGNDFGTVSGGGGTLTRSDTSPRWRLRTPTGSRYTFNDGGGLVSAKVSTSGWGAPGFDYGYTQVGNDERLSYIRDPLGRQVDFTWIDDGSNDRLDLITAWTGVTWELEYTGGQLTSVIAPAQEVVTFGYLPDGSSDINTIGDGQNHTTVVGYSSPLPGKPAKVGEVLQAGVTGAYTFTYTGPFTGQMAARTDLVDPRGIPTPDSLDFTTKTWFNVAGLPIRVDGPRDDQGLWGITTQLWDTNSNIVCRRSPVANTLAAGCDNPNAPGPNGLQTDWTYQSRSPYLVKTETLPQNDDGQRAVTTYGYDEGFQELYAEYFDNANLAGEPIGAGFEPDLNIDWGTGSPTPLGGQVNDWSMRLTGRLEITSGRTFFKILSDTNDGIRLHVGSKEVFDCWADAIACDSEDFEFEGGEKRFVLEFRDQGVGARMHLRWHKASQSQFEEVPTADLAPEVNLLTSVEDPAGITTYSYEGEDKARRRVSSQARDGRSTSYDYDAFGRVDNITDPRGETTTNVYDGACVDTVTDRTGAETHFECNAAGDVTQQTREIRAVASQPLQDRITTTTYDALGRLNTMSERRNGVDEQTLDNDYDLTGRLSRSTDALGAPTDFEYNSRGLVITETLPDPDGTGPDPRPVIHHTYDGAGNRITTTDARGRVWRTSFDALDRVTVTRDPLCDLYGDSDPRCAKTETSYNLVLNTIKTTDPAGVEAAALFDLLGQRTSEAVGTLPTATFTYDPAGRLTEEIDPAGVATQRTYNDFGELTSETRPTGPGGTLKTTSFEYDLGGRMTRVTDALGEDTTYGYDDEGRLTEVTLPLSPAATTSYVLSDAGELIRITDADGRVRSAVFDERGRRTSLTDPRGTTSYVYDVASRLKEVHLPTGTTQYFVYDELGRRTQRFGGSSSAPVDVESYAYDPAGNMTQASKSGSTVQMSYDPAGRMATVTAQGATTTYTYEQGRLISRADASGTSSFTYNANGQLQTITDPFGTVATYDYFSNGRKHTRTLTPAGLTSTWTYDPAGRVDTLNTLRGTQNVASADLGYDALGNVTTKTQTIAGLPASENGTWNYGYDEASRLTAAADPAGTSTQYGYDRAGNRTSVKVGSSPAVTTTLDAAGYPDSASDGTDYVTDATGALTKITRPGSIGGLTGTTEYTYDTWGRLARAHMVPTPAVPPKAPETVTYAYDALDRMITRSTGLASASLVSTTYRYAGQTQDLVKTSKLEGTPVAETRWYSHSPEGPLASSWTTVNSSGTSWYATDPHGDLVAEVSPTATTGSRSYSAWGEKRATSGTAPGPFGFQGDWTDPSTELVDMGARLYAGELGRFTSMDPLEGSTQNPPSLNRFTYGLNSPIRHTDPNGMMPLDEPGGGGDHANHSVTRTARTDSRPPHSFDSGAQRQSFRFTPQPGYGVVRGGFWIRSEDAFWGFWGDNRREFDDDAPSWRYRVFIVINYESGTAVVRVNPTCGSGGGDCTPARPLILDDNVTFRDGPGGSVAVGIHVSDSKLPTPPAPHIDALIFSLPIPGSDRLAGFIVRESYPAVELYQRTQETTRALVQETGVGDIAGYFTLALGLGDVNAFPDSWQLALPWINR